MKYPQAIAASRKLPRRDPMLDGEPWREQAACRDPDPEAWFPGNEAPEAAWAYARSVCNGCPVAADCLAESLLVGDDYGMFGGKTPRERAAIQKREPKRRNYPAPHGTESGYNRHQRDHTPTCDACRAAGAAARKQRAMRGGAA